MTYGYDNARDGFNPNTLTITPSTIPFMHLAWQTGIPDYRTQTQPILATNEGSHAGVLVVGGGSGNVYGYDALTGAQVWSTPLGNASYNCGSSTNYLGIGGTAVLDPTSNIVYVASNSNAAVNQPINTMLVQLNAGTGAYGNRVSFNPGGLAGEQDFTHTALALNNGTVYVGTGSTCDISAWRGRVAAVNTSTMTLANTFFTTYEQSQGPSPSPAPLSGGGVWGWGGVAVDSGGNVWTGVGNVDTTTGSGGPQTPFETDANEFDAMGEHLIEVSGDLSTLVASNYPGFTYGGVSRDLDLNGSPVLGQPLGCDGAVAVQGKSGYLYLFDTTNLTSPVAGYKFTDSSFHGSNMGNPAFSPLTGFYYAAVASSAAGGVAPAPGMVAISTCNATSAIVWSTAFGPDSVVAGAPRSEVTVTAGGVVFVGTPCELDSSNGCTGTTGNYGGALWALDAVTGTLLNGGNPIVTTPSQIRMGAVADADWVYVIDQEGHFYGLTVDPSVPAASHARRPSPARRATPIIRHQARGSSF